MTLATRMKSAWRGVAALAVTLIGTSAFADDTPTFAKDVAPILFDKCSACHRPGAMAPMSLMTFEDARPWARAIKTKVVAREMPPWFADRTVGKWSNDMSLTQDEIDTIAKWVDTGAPLGNAMREQIPERAPAAVGGAQPRHRLYDVVVLAVGGHVRDRVEPDVVRVGAVGAAR